METAINILKAIFSKDTWLPLITTFLGAFFAFQFNFYLLKKVKKNEQITNLNYLIVALHHFLLEMEVLDNAVERQLLAIKKCQNYCEEKPNVLSSMHPDILEAFATIGYVKPLTKINIANYAFADKNTGFIISIIKAVRSVEDVGLSLKMVNHTLEKLMHPDKNEAQVLYFKDLVVIQIKNLELMRVRVLQTVFDIKKCGHEMVGYNSKYLHFTIAEIPMTEELHKLLTKATKFVEQQSKNP